MSTSTSRPSGRPALGPVGRVLQQELDQPLLREPRGEVHLFGQGTDTCTLLHRAHPLQNKMNAHAACSADRCFASALRGRWGRADRVAEHGAERVVAAGEVDQQRAKRQEDDDLQGGRGLSAHWAGE